MSVRVKNGTPVHGEPLCDTCVYAQVRRGFRESEMLVICVAQDPALRVPFPVRECSVYRNKTRPSMYEMQQIALIVTPRGPKHATGFASGASSEPRRTEVELILEDK